MIITMFLLLACQGNFSKTKEFPWLDEAYKWKQVELGGPEQGCAISGIGDLVCWQAKTGPIIIEKNLSDIRLMGVSGRRVCGLDSEGLINCWWRDPEFSENGSLVVYPESVEEGLGIEEGWYIPPEGSFVDFDFDDIFDLGINQQGKLIQGAAKRFPSDLEGTFISIAVGDQVSCLLSKS